jgi:erythromycin esterase-like protein
MIKFSFFFSLLLALTSCSEQKEIENPSVIFVELPKDFTTIPDSTFHHLDTWFSDAQIIGLSEGEHGMHESMNFRNAYIKHLVESNEIQILAFESGLIESRMVNDYINGADLNLDTVLAQGISYTFGQFSQTRELMVWLRETNASREKEARVKFYGFDMAGNAPNPYLENAQFAIQEYLKFLEKVDPKLHHSLDSFQNTVQQYLNIKDDEIHVGITFLDWNIKERNDYRYDLEIAQVLTIQNKDDYIQKTDAESYEWALQSLVCAIQNFDFLTGYHKEVVDQNCRERFMLDNLKWIQKREPNKRILLFAHLAHLAKDITRTGEKGEETLSTPMFGELLVQEFGSKYMVLGNFFSSLDYYDSIEDVPENSFSSLLYKKYKKENFCVQVDPTDTLFNKHRLTRTDRIGAHRMTPSKGIDVILYTHKQHFFTEKLPN